MISYLHILLSSLPGLILHLHDSVHHFSQAEQRSLPAEPVQRNYVALTRKEIFSLFLTNDDNCEQREREGWEYTSISHPKNVKKRGVLHHHTSWSSLGGATDGMTGGSGIGFGFGWYWNFCPSLFGSKKCRSASSWIVRCFEFQDKIKLFLPSRYSSSNCEATFLRVQREITHCSCSVSSL